MHHGPAVAVKVRRGVARETLKRLGERFGVVGRQLGVFLDYPQPRRAVLTVRAGFTWLGPYPGHDLSRSVRRTAPAVPGGFPACARLTRACRAVLRQADRRARPLPG